MNKPLNVLFIDNYDSFVFNLVDEFARRGCNVQVYRNSISTERALEILDSMSGPKLVVISPGPGTPHEAGCSVDLIRQLPDDVPMFGVCLGHQALVEAYGGKVGPAGEIVHGKSSLLPHKGDGLFENVPSPMMVGRYHSLAGVAIPDELMTTARINNLVLAIEHRDKPLWGVQFHPESILTPHGGRLIENVIKRASTPQGRMKTREVSHV